jgi:hypothetical protein
MQASSEQGHDDHVGFDVDDRRQVIALEIPPAIDAPGTRALAGGPRLR